MEEQLVFQLFTEQGEFNFVSWVEYHQKWREALRKEFDRILLEIIKDLWQKELDKTSSPV